MASKLSKWTCDICRIASFQTYDEALHHEQSCNNKGAAGASALASVCTTVAPPPTEEQRKIQTPTRITMIGVPRKDHQQQISHHHGTVGERRMAVSSSSSSSSSANIISATSGAQAAVLLGGESPPQQPLATKNVVTVYPLAAQPTVMVEEPAQAHEAMNERSVPPPSSAAAFDRERERGRGYQNHHDQHQHPQHHQFIHLPSSLHPPTIHSQTGSAAPIILVHQQQRHPHRPAPSVLVHQQQPALHNPSAVVLHDDPHSQGGGANIQRGEFQMLNCHTPQQRRQQYLNDNTAGATTVIQHGGGPATSRATDIVLSPAVPNPLLVMQQTTVAAHPPSTVLNQYHQQQQKEQQHSQPQHHYCHSPTPPPAAPAAVDVLGATSKQLSSSPSDARSTTSKKQKREKTKKNRTVNIDNSKRHGKDEGVPHHVTTTTVTTSPSSHSALKKKTKQVYVCDICKIAYFETYGEAEEHEKHCCGVVPPATTKNSKKRMDSLLNDEDHGDKQLLAMKNNLPVTTCNKNDSIIQKTSSNPPQENANNSQHQDSVIKNSKEHQFLFKKDRKFTRPQQHQNDDCKEQQYDDKRKENSITEGNYNIVTIDHLITAELSPLLRNYVDSQDFFKLSSFHARLLSCIDLFEMQIPSTKSVEGQADKGEVHLTQESIVSLRCTHCREILSPEPSEFFLFKNWTKELLKENLSSLLYKHLHSACEGIPVKEMQRLKASLPYKDVGKISFGDFIEKYFDENGIVDDINITSDCGENNNIERGGGDDEHNDILEVEKPAPKASKMVLLKPPEWVTPNYSCRRRTEALGISMLNNDQTSGYKIFPISGVKGMEQIEKNLSPMNKLVIKQLTFLVQESRQTFISRKPYYHVALRCKHCGTSTYLNSLSNWFKFVYTMTYSHLTKSCPSIPMSLRKELLSHQGTKKIKYATKFTGLKQFCDSLSDHYGFIERESSYGDRVCVPSIPAISKSVETAIIKKRKSAREAERSESPLLEKSDHDDNSSTTKIASPKKVKMTTNNGINKDSDDVTNKNDNTASSASNKNNDVPNEDEAQAILMAEKAFKEGIIVEGENGCTTFLLPPNGVPLLCSFTTKMASKLNHHHRLLIDHFELIEDESKMTETGSPQLLLRCQNCSSNPKTAFRATLTTGTFHVMLSRCCAHLESCPSTSQAIRSEITRTKTANDVACISLQQYCQFLISIYGMVDTTVVENNMVLPAATWDSATCTYIVIEGIWGPRTLVEIDRKVLRG